MSKVVGLDGAPIKLRNGKSDPIITKMLDRARNRNKQGDVAALVLITVSPDGIPTQMFHWGSSDGSFTFMLGALDIAKHSLIQHAVEAAEVEEIISEP